MMKTSSAFGLAVVALVLGYALGYFTADEAEVVVEEVRQEAASATADLSFPTNDNAREEAAQNTPNPNGTAFVIPMSRLSESQRAFVRTAGVEGEEIVVTNAMVACAEASIGATRVAEIKNGASPSMSEGIKLMACYE
jgi:hypothetical protein